MSKKLRAAEREEEIAKLRKEIDTFLAWTNMGRTSFSVQAVKSTAFVDAFRNGRRPGMKTIKKVRDFMASWSRDRVQEARMIRDWKGFIEVDRTGTPQELPPSMKARHFRKLVYLGLVKPAGDAMFGAPSQTYRPVPECV